MNNIDQLTINTIRALSADMIEKANSGHPGKPLGSAPMAYTLWRNHMAMDPNNPDWANRDRFVLSAGHASALIYSLLHLFEYDVTMEDIKEFRQYGSRTPGHPEYRDTVGVETTTGPLGAGLATAVGMAMAQEHLAAKYNKPNYELFNNYTYVLAGDGDMMEGITSEASSLAGTLGLGRLIILYDSNEITIEGRTDLAFTENVRERYESYGFETYLVEDGNDLDALNAAIEKAKSNLDKPSFIEVKTKIGYLSPVEDTEKAHGAPLGEAGIKTLKENMNYPSQDPFYVDESVRTHMSEVVKEKQEAYKSWVEMLENYKKDYPELYAQWEEDNRELTLDEFLENEALWEFENKPMATRSLSGIVINRLNEKYKNLFGGSADLASSNMTLMENETSFSKDNYAGKNLHFGVREHAMAAIGNGIQLYGGLKPYVATFFVFTDYLKPMARLASLMSIPTTFVLTHDSIGVGEDGPTHEPVEQLTMMRSQPNFTVFRPADGVETMAGWAVAMSSQKTPTGLVLTRQNIPQLEGSSKDAVKGGYVISDSDKIDVILMSSGSEVSLALDAKEVLEKEGIGVRVVSMPSMELFEAQSQEYQESVLPKDVRKRVAIEAGSSLSWGKYVGLDGNYVTMDTFGASGKGDVLFEKFGFTVENVVNKIKEIIESA